MNPSHGMIVLASGRHRCRQIGMQRAGAEH
jgi:hypothetical protein